jgi:hypothetical protein
MLLHNPTLFSKKIENIILLHLMCSHADAEQTPEAQNHIRRSRLGLYNFINEQVDTISVGSFNKIVEDMKKIGLIGTTHKGGLYLFLTDEARRGLVEGDETTSERRGMIPAGKRALRCVKAAVAAGTAACIACGKQPLRAGEFWSSLRYRKTEVFGYVTCLGCAESEKRAEQMIDQGETDSKLIFVSGGAL